MVVFKVILIFTAMVSLTYGAPKPGFFGKHEHHLIHVPYKVHTVHHHHVQKVPIYKEVQVIKHVPVIKEVHVPVVKEVHVPVHVPVHVDHHHHHEDHHEVDYHKGFGSSGSGWY